MSASAQEAQQFSEIQPQGQQSASFSAALMRIARCLNYLCGECWREFYGQDLFGMIGPRPPEVPETRLGRNSKDKTTQVPSPKPQLPRYRVWVQMRKTRNPLDHVRFEVQAVGLRDYTGDGNEIYAAVQRQPWNPRPGAYCQLFFLEDGHYRQVAYPGDGSLVALDDEVHHDQRLLLAHDSGGVTYDGGPPLVLGDPEQGGRSLYDPQVSSQAA